MWLPTARHQCVREGPNTTTSDALVVGDAARRLPARRNRLQRGHQRLQEGQIPVQELRRLQVRQTRGGGTPSARTVAASCRRPRFRRVCFGWHVPWRHCAVGHGLGVTVCAACGLGSRGCPVVPGAWGLYPPTRVVVALAAVGGWIGGISNRKASRSNRHGICCRDFSLATPAGRVLPHRGEGPATAAGTTSVAGVGGDQQLREAHSLPTGARCCHVQCLISVGMRSGSRLLR